MDGVFTRKTSTALILFAATMGATVFLLRPQVIRGNANEPVVWDLPDVIGPYQGEKLFFCQNDQCARAFSENKLADSGTNQCRFCTNALSQISIGEAKMLPAGTPIKRRLYKTISSPELQTSFVFSGMERESIHRPQICLVAQGNRLINEYSYQVKIDQKRRMPIRILETMRTLPPDALGKRRVQRGIYAYWYFSAERETPSYASRLFWISWDNVMRSYRPRWAYVSISFNLKNTDRTEDYQKILDDFVPRIYPLITEIRNGFMADGARITAAGGE